MATRIPGVQRSGSLRLFLRPAPRQPTTSPLLPRIQSVSLTRQEKKRMAKQEPYRWELMRQRVASHAKVKERIAADLKAKLGDPVRGLETPFLESLDSAGQSPKSKPRTDKDGNLLEEPHALPTSPHILNHMVSKSELDKAVQNAWALTRPIQTEWDKDTIDHESWQRTVEDATRLHEKRVEVMRRITHIDNASSKDRLHANIRRCIETFGRHETDKTLKPKPLSRGVEKSERPVRGGPDVGSSEVQIAILTTKIRALASELEKGRGYKDKFGKRDLRLLVHRRQKLLTYMERKERGSERWTHMIKTLGLSPATWKGQITL